MFYAFSIAALLDRFVFTVFWIPAVEEEEELDFFSMDLNEVETVEDFFWTVWMVFFLLT